MIGGKFDRAFASVKSWAGAGVFSKLNMDGVYKPRGDFYNNVVTGTLGSGLNARAFNNTRVERRRDSL